jgi:hypothetical protein
MPSHTLERTVHETWARFLICSEPYSGCSGSTRGSQGRTHGLPERRWEGGRARLRLRWGGTRCGETRRWAHVVERKRRASGAEGIGVALHWYRARGCSGRSGRASRAGSRGRGRVLCGGGSRETGSCAKGGVVGAAGAGGPRRGRETGRRRGWPQEQRRRGRGRSGGGPMRQPREGWRRPRYRLATS